MYAKLCKIHSEDNFFWIPHLPLHPSALAWSILMPISFTGKARTPPAATTIGRCPTLAEAAHHRLLHHATPWDCWLPKSTPSIAPQHFFRIMENLLVSSLCCNLFLCFTFSCVMPPGLCFLTIVALAWGSSVICRTTSKQHTTSSRCPHTFYFQCIEPKNMLFGCLRYGINHYYKLRLHFISYMEQVDL